MTKVEFTITIHSVTDTIRKEAENKAKEAYVMTLLKHGEISSGKASQLLGISRLDVIELMSKYDISLFDDSYEFRGISARNQSSKNMVESK